MNVRYLAITLAVVLALLDAIGCGSLNPFASTPPTSVDEVLQRWAAAADHIHTLRGSQSFALVRADGTRLADTSSDQYPDGTLRSTEEVYQLEADRVRFRFVAQTSRGEVVTMFDGKNAFRYRSWLREVYRPLPESYAGGAYWIDDVDDLALLTLLRATRDPDGKFPIPFELVGMRQMDGRNVIELVVQPSPNRSYIGPFGMEGNRFYLDAATFLPYRILSFGAPPDPNAPRSAVERTVTHLQVNPGVGDADFALSLPPDTVTVYEAAHWAPRLQTFNSLAEATQSADFPIYVPRDQKPQEIFTLYEVELKGKRSPVIAVTFGDGAQMVQGRYLPQFGRESVDGMTVGQAQTIDLDGQAATLRAGTYGFSAITLHHGATVIEITTQKGSDQALTLAKSLEPVRP